MARRHILNLTSVSFGPLGSDSKIPVVEALRVLSDVGLAKKCLIVTPAACVPLWGRKLSDWDLEGISLRGNQRKRLKILRKDGIFITSYASLHPTGLGIWLSHRAWDVVVIDEVHRIKNPQAMRSKFCYEIADQAKRKIALTSSGIRKVHEIWGIMRAIDPDVFGKKYYDFLRKYFVRGKYGWSDSEPAEGATEAMLRKLQTRSVA